MNSVAETAFSPAPRPLIRQASPATDPKGPRRTEFIEVRGELGPPVGKATRAPPARAKTELVAGTTFQPTEASFTVGLPRGGSSPALPG